jgi:putative transcriptional regulator
MSIIFRLDRVMADRKMPLNELARRIGHTDSNLSILKTGKARAVRVSTLDALCRELACQPGDLLEYVPGEPSGGQSAGGENE